MNSKRETGKTGVEAYLRQQVKKHGGICLKWKCPGYNGAPDDIVLFFGAVFFVETKAKDGRLRSAQKTFHKKLAKHGFDVVVLNTKEKVKLWVELQASVLNAKFEKELNTYTERAISGVFDR